MRHRRAHTVEAVRAPAALASPSLGSAPRVTAPATVLGTHLAGSGLVRIAQTSRWTLTCVEYSYGVVRLARSGGVTQVVVGERAEHDQLATLEESFVAAACTDEGELLVAVRAAPPALVVTRSSCRTWPRDGSTRNSQFPAPGERVILLSCAVFESVPDVLVDGVNGSSGADLATQDAESLLVSLVGGAERGAGVVIDHHPWGGDDGMA